MSSNNGFLPMDELTLNALWNERVRPTGEPVAGGDRLDPAMVTTIERLTAFGNATPPASSRERVRAAVRANVQTTFDSHKETDMLATPALERATTSIFPKRARPISDRRLRWAARSRRWLLAQAAVAAILILALLGGWFIYQQGSDHPAVAPVASPEATVETVKEQYRYGPNRPGVSPSDGPTGDSVELWRVQTGAGINAEAAIVDGTVFVGSLDGNMYAYDALTGEERWRFAGAAGFPGSPAVVDGVVYAAADDGSLYAIDSVTGAERWNVPGAREGASPSVVDGVVYVGGADGKLYARDAQTGAEIWSVTLGESASRSTSVANGLVYVGSADTVLHAFDAATGEELWSHQGGSGGVASPVIVDGTVYEAFFDGDNTIVALDAATGEERWIFHNPNDASMWVPVVSDGRVYSGSDDGSMYAIDAESGTVLWQFETGARIDAAPTMAGGVIYFASQDGTLYGLDPGTGTQLFGAPIGGVSDFGPAVLDAIAYTGTTDGEFVAIGGSNTPAIAAPGAAIGAEASSTIAPATMAASPVSATGTAPAQLIWSLDRSDGLFDRPGALALDPDGRLWVFDSTGRIVILDSNGTLVESWGTLGSGEGEFNFVASNGDVFGGAVFADNGDFYILDNGNFRVLKFDRDRTLLVEWGSYGRADGQFNAPIAMGMAANGNILVSDSAQARIQEFTPDGAFITSWPILAGAGGFVVGPNGNVFEARICEVNEWSAPDTMVRTLTIYDAAACDWVGGMTFDQNGHLFASVASAPYDPVQAGIAVLDDGGTIVAKWNPRSVAGDVGTDRYDGGMVLDGLGNIYVEDYFPHTIMKFQLLPPLAPQATPAAS